MMPDEKAIIQKRNTDLEGGLIPFMPEQRDEVRSALHAMLGGFRSLRETGDDAETAVEVLLAVLREFPAWAIDETCLRIAQCDIAIDPPLDRRWAPSDAQIHACVTAIIRPYRDTLRAARALLAAQVATPEPQRPSRAEIEAKLGRSIGEAQSVNDGKHAQRVAADLAARKALHESAPPPSQEESTGPPGDEQAA